MTELDTQRQDLADSIQRAAEDLADFWMCDVDEARSWVENAVIGEQSPHRIVGVTVLRPSWRTRIADWLTRNLYWIR